MDVIGQGIVRAPTTLPVLRITPSPERRLGIDRRQRHDDAPRADPARRGDHSRRMNQCQQGMIGVPKSSANLRSRAVGTDAEGDGHPLFVRPIGFVSSPGEDGCIQEDRPVPSLIVIEESHDRMPDRPGDLEDDLGMAARAPEDPGCERGSACFVGWVGTPRHLFGTSFAEVGFAAARPRLRKWVVDIGSGRRYLRGMGSSSRTAAVRRDLQFLKEAVEQVAQLLVEETLQQHRPAGPTIVTCRAFPRPLKRPNAAARHNGRRCGPSGATA